MRLPTALAPYKAWLVLGSYAIALGVGGYGGWKLRDADYQAHLRKDAEARVKAQVHTAKVEATTGTISQVLRDQGDTQQARIRTVYKNIIEKVPVYVPSLPPRAAPGDGLDRPDSDTLPLGAVRLHDYAALGVDPPVPAPPGEPVGAPSGVSLPALIGTVAGNYGVCRADHAEVMTWREWYKREAAVWSSPARQ